MSFYQRIATIGKRFIPEHTLFKYGFNWSPMYRRSNARIQSVSPDLLHIKIRLPLNYKNRNYVGTIFGGSLFAAVDPIPMVQLINLLDDSFIVWDKSAQIFFKRPGKETLYAQFEYSLEELAEIRRRVAQENEIEMVKITQLKTADQTVICEVHKTIYIADKEFFKEKRKRRKEMP